jgi:CheY-like chemotaxis protein
MKKSLMACVALAVASIGLAVAAEKVQSGLEKGAKVPAFYVKDITGPAKDGDELCYRCRYGNQPVVTIFAQEMTDEVAALAKELDGVVAKNRDQKMAGFVVLMASDPAKAAPSLTKAAEKLKIEQLPLTTFKGTEGPKGYKINEKAAVTVMMWVDGTVKVSEGFNKGELNKETIAKVVAETRQILD